ncbi:MAG: FtsW/RodA/SpoVE family cell cycle protein, partial [Lachnospiraceae bacterium]|nr:FtsW/RodA/SpoVE family cell cycle protein [Lachnospiraceae bacterium]
SMLSERTDFKQVVKVTLIAGMHILILFVEKDLGGALIFFIIYAIMLYTATGKLLYLIGLFGGGGAAAVFAVMLFKDSFLQHVSVRILAWQNPWAYINNQGYQVAQSLFALGTGGFLGSGLTGGMPNLIPVAESDFIFSAIAEEYGVLFALALILICFSTFIAFMNAAMKCKRRFYKHLTVGFGTCYIFQVLLNIGGVTKFIPSTGVTLPLVSYGLSSVLSTLIIFNIVQGVYIIEKKEAMQVEKARKQLEAAPESAGAAGKRTKKNKGK